MVRTTFLCGILPLALAGCTVGAYEPVENHDSLAKQLAAPLPSDEALGGASVGEILDAVVTIPPRARLAVLHFGEQGARGWWSHEFGQLDQDLEKDLLRQLRLSERVSEAAALPAMIIREKTTVPNLRLAAARYQADLLLVYRVQSRVRERSRLLKPTQIKASCVVEAVLFDVRTGLIPHAATAAEEVLAEKGDDDFSIEESMSKAEVQAVSTALREIGEDVVSFLLRAS